MSWAIFERNIDIVKLLIDNFKDEININVQDEYYFRTAIYYSCWIQHDSNVAKLLIDNFKDEIDIMLLDFVNVPAWYEFLILHGEEKFKDLFLPLLLNRDKSKDPQGLTPLHIAYLLKNEERKHNVNTMVKLL